MTDDRLNPTLILPRMLEIFRRKMRTKKAKYASVYSTTASLTAPEEYNGYIDDDFYIIYNGSEYLGHDCVKFECFLKNALYIIKTAGISKCGGTSSGNYILECLTLYAQTYGYNRVIISLDTSQLPLDFGDGDRNPIMIELNCLSILTYGESWYNRKGFYSTIFREEQATNIPIINMSVSKWLKNAEGDNKYKYFVHMFSKIITRLNGEGDTNNNSFDNTSIKKIFSFIMQRIRESCSNPDKICNIEDKPELNEYDKFIAMVCERSHFRIELNNLIKNIVPNTNNLKTRGGKIKKYNRKTKTKTKYKSKYKSKYNSRSAVNRKLCRTR